MSIRIQGTTVIDDNRNAVNLNSVGIGTASPGQKLNVVGTGSALFTSNVYHIATNSGSTGQGMLLGYFTGSGGGGLIAGDGIGGQVNNLVFGGYNGSAWGERARLTGNGVFSATGDMRAPIFYDSNNTAFYVDPASTSIINSLGVSSPANIQGVSIIGNFGQWQPHSTYTNFNSNVAYWGWNYVQGNSNAPNSTSSQWYRGRFSLGSEYPQNYSAGHYWMEMTVPRFSVTSAGHLWIRYCESGSVGGWSQAGSNIIGTGTATSDYRAPIFYDSNDTGYYVDPASTTRLNDILGGGASSKATSWHKISIETGGFIAKSGNRGVGAYADGSNTNLFAYDYNSAQYQHLLLEGSYVSSTNSHRAPIFYDSNNTAYYNDPNSQSRISAITRDQSRVNTSRYPIGHYTPGETVFEIDPTWTQDELRAYFNSNGVSWSADASSPGGYTIRIDGAVSVGGVYGSGFPYIPVDQNDVFYMECWIKSVNGSQRHYMGSIDYNASFGSLGGNPGSFGYWTMSNTTIGTSWVKVTGYISGFGNSVGQFKSGTKYWTPQALFNYTNVSGTTACLISGWKVVKVSQPGNRTFPNNVTINGSLTVGGVPVGSTTAGAVGTYMFGGGDVGVSVTYNLGDTTGGSGLKAMGVRENFQTSPTTQVLLPSNFPFVGTWRCMGFLEAWNFYDKKATLWLRIA